MACCPRTFCPGCEQEMIHRDNRRGYESASGFGQIVSRDGPRDFTFGDVDGYARKWCKRHTLLRLLEHKQPRQPLKAQQKRVLHDLDAILAHAIDCPDSPIRLHPASGVWIVRGEIEAATTGRRATRFGGPQQIWNPRHGWLTADTADDMWRWLSPQLLEEAA